MGKALIEKVCSCTETGFKRQGNQDAILALYKEDRGLFLIADGMGGHYKGEIASKIATVYLRNWWLGTEKNIPGTPFQELVSSLKLAVRKANSEILKEYERRGARGGTTLCLLFVCRDAYAVMNVGDSHVYHYGKGVFDNMMADDVWENQKHIREMASEEELKKSRHYGHLTKALGIRDVISPGISTGRIDGRECFFLCSDGIYKYCPEKILRKNMMWACLTGNLEKAIGRIKETVYQNGAGDNLSMVMVRMKETSGDKR